MNVNDGPIDYRSLWIRLGHELKQLSADISNRAMTDTPEKILKHQGAWWCIQAIQAKMEDLLAAFSENRSLDA